jgi:hypothetical protein
MTAFSKGDHATGYVCFVVVLVLLLLLVVYRVFGMVPGNTTAGDQLGPVRLVHVKDTPWTAVSACPVLQKHPFD